MTGSKIKWLLILTLVIIAVYAVLLIPETPPVIGAYSTHSAFVWGQDEYWSSLESEFRQKRDVGCSVLTDTISSRMRALDSIVYEVGAVRAAPSDPALNNLEKAFFELGVLIAVCPELLREYVRAFEQMRCLIKDLSLEWDLGSREASDRLYRLLYGGRTAVEEAMLQAEPGAILELESVCDEPSKTPSAEINGVQVHSGDILISRGGAPTSALIARGSDYAGNFSHAALCHVDDSTGEISIIEAHIECGVTVSTREQYLNDKKLRIMVLRPRSDLPSMMVDPMLPHRAACLALDMARSNHIPYDFEMNTRDDSRLFCSEVVSSAYDSLDFPLWKKLSHISEPGLRSWLAAFGVRNFTTQEPSDLEYDPQLRVVAEWRDPETLMEDHIDNAIIDVMLEGASNGDRLEYTWYMLPAARVIKLYSVILNCFGEVGPIPEGMGATSALQNQWLSEQHRGTKIILKKKISEFRKANGYSPPYWELVRLAREAYKSHGRTSL
ncbi:MAG: YiiX/YebB-like N1pC/P60 family cysteine hydrolase [Candidatus Zixiibacteriota bacterium]